MTDVIKDNDDEFDTIKDVKVGGKSDRTERTEDTATTVKPKEAEAPLPEKSTTICGISIRPVTLGSIQILQKIGSRLIAGVEVKDQMELLDEIFDFLYIHSISANKAIDFCFLEKRDRQKEVMRWSSNIEFSDLPTLIDKTMEVLNKLTEDQVKAEPPSDLKDSMGSRSGGKD